MEAKNLRGLPLTFSIMPAWVSAKASNSADAAFQPKYTTHALDKSKEDSRATESTVIAQQENAVDPPVSLFL